MEKTLTLKINRYDYNLTILLTIFVTSAMWLWFIYATNITSERTISFTLPRDYTSSYLPRVNNKIESELKQQILAAQEEEKKEKEDRIKAETENSAIINEMMYKLNDNEDNELIQEFCQNKAVYSNYKMKEIVDNYTKSTASLPSCYSFHNAFFPVISEEDGKSNDYVSILDLKDNISYNMNLTEPSGISKEDFVALISSMKADKSDFFKENAEEIYDLCQNYQINEIFFCGLIAAESGWEITNSHRKKNNYISTMGSGGMICYSTKSEGLEEAAKLLHENYLTEGGKYYHGATIDGVQKSFCSESPQKWKGLVFSCMKLIVC